MMDAILRGESVEDHTEILFQSDVKGWNMNSTYSWNINHRPTINSLSLEVKEDNKVLFSNEWDKDFDGDKHLGKLGVFTHSQVTRFFDMSVKPLCTIV